MTFVDFMPTHSVARHNSDGSVYVHWGMELHFWLFNYYKDVLILCLCCRFVPSSPSIYLNYNQNKILLVYDSFWPSTDHYIDSVSYLIIQFYFPVYTCILGLRTSRINSGRGCCILALDGNRVQAHPRNTMDPTQVAGFWQSVYGIPFITK